MRLRTHLTLTFCPFAERVERHPRGPDGAWQNGADNRFPEPPEEPRDARAVPSSRPAVHRHQLDVRVRQVRIVLLNCIYS